MVFETTAFNRSATPPRAPSRPGDAFYEDATPSRRAPCESLALAPSSRRTGSNEIAGAACPRAGLGSVAVVGLGPGAQEWLTPEAQTALQDAEELVGYGPYLDWVPVRPGQRRHASDNRVEVERARHALELAAAGANVAVVSSGGPGIFALPSTAASRDSWEMIGVLVLSP